MAFAVAAAPLKACQHACQPINISALIALHHPGYELRTRCHLCTAFFRTLTLRTDHYPATPAHPNSSARRRSVWERLLSGRGVGVTLRNAGGGRLSPAEEAQLPAFQGSPSVRPG